MSGTLLTDLLLSFCIFGRSDDIYIKSTYHILYYLKQPLSWYLYACTLKKCTLLKLTDTSIMGWENIHVFSHCICILACPYNKTNTIQYNTIHDYYSKSVILAQACSYAERSLAFATGTTFKHQRVTWPGLFRKLIECLRIAVWHMSVHSLARCHMIRVWKFVYYTLV